jgi:acyl carrier protein
MRNAIATPTRGEVADTARAHLAAELKIDASAITEDCVLRELPGVDSIQLLRVVSRLEREWDTEFEDEDIFSSVTFADLADMVISYLSGGPDRR